METALDPTQQTPAPAVTAGAGNLAPAALDPLTASHDAINRPFDPAKFIRAFDTLGRWKNLNKGGRPKDAPAGETAAAAAPDFSDVLAVAREGDAEKISDMAQNATAETLLGILQAALVLIGEDEGVISDQEKTLLSRPLQRVLDKYGVGKDAMPAEIELAVAVSIIVIARLKKPKTATTVAKIRAWCSSVWFRKKGHDLAKSVERETREVPQA